VIWLTPSSALSSTYPDADFILRPLPDGLAILNEGVATDDGWLSPHLEYMDALPFPLEELVARRAAVCDYCFFGGPDKNSPTL
jgi:hypothetical protein